MRGQAFEEHTPSAPFISAASAPPPKIHQLTISRNMRGFIILCLTGLAVAAPQGYNYAVSHQPHQQYGAAGSAGSTLKDAQAGSHDHTFAVVQNQVGAFGGAVAELEQFAPSYAGVQPQPQPQGRYLAPAVVAANAVSNGPLYETPLQYSQPQQQQHHHQHQEAQPQPIVSKRFFVHSAPEEHDDDYKEKHITVGVPKKNYNVVFIKAPAKSAQKTAVKITPAVNEDKTVIYVLAKKPEEAQIDAQVYEPATTTTKPEVYFIKYKTNEEAAHAQQSIQAQYDHLGGSTQISNEGVAPITSVIGSLDAARQSADAAELQGEHEAHPQVASNNGYLPPSRTFH